MNLKNIAGFAVGPITTALIGLVTVPVIAWVFPPADVGRMNVFQIAVSFALLLSVLGLDQAYVREYHEFKDKAQLLLSCFFPGLILLVVLGGVSIFFASDLARLLYAEADSRLYLITLAAFFASYCSRFLSLILRMQERGWAYSSSQVLPKVIQLALIVIVAFTVLEKNFLLLQSVSLIAMVCVLFLYAKNTFPEWKSAMKAKLEWSQLKKFLAFGFPLIFSGIAYWGLAAMSALALRAWAPLEELAIYSVANSFAGAAVVFQAVFTVVWAPTVYKWVSQGVDMTIVDTVARQALAVVCAIVAISGSLSWLCDWLLPEQYLKVKYLLLCMLMQPLLYTLSEITCVGIAIERKTIYSLWVTFAALVTNFCLNYILVPRYGAAGAVVSNAFSFTVFFIARTEVSARIWRDFPRANLYAVTAVLLIGTTATVFKGDADPVGVHVVWLAALFVFLLVFRNRWVEIVGLVRNRRA